LMSGTPAERAGLSEDDVVTEVNGEPVTDGIALIVAIRTHQPGETIEFTVRRGDRERQVRITLDGEVG
jgi:putative serine protease PepD